MTNAEIVELLDDTIACMELMEVNSFKINAWRNLSQVVEKASQPIRAMQEEEKKSMFSRNMFVVIQSILETGTFPERDSLLAEIPPGVKSMMRINGIGPKKVAYLWKEAGITTLTELKEACDRSLLSQYKGFGLKLQETIRQGIDFLESVEGCCLMHQGDAIAAHLEKDWKAIGLNGERTGDLATRHEVVRTIEFLFPMIQREAVMNWAKSNPGLQIHPEKSGPCHFTAWLAKPEVWIRLHFAYPEGFEKQRFVLNSNDAHWAQASQKGIPLYARWKSAGYASEEELYTQLGLSFIDPELRGSGIEWEADFGSRSQFLVKWEDLKGCIHNHSHWSDGKNTLAEMATACKDRGWRYFGIADHSRSAQYANGLSEDRVFSQWAAIDDLNKTWTDFRILKGIESDILPDGRLDYSESILAGFDYVVASVHSGMKMDKNTATARLIKAIEHPATRILGHCSGRLLLRRPGYPLDYDKIIDACVANQVAIELNAHPARLDMDWENLARALERGAWISINPDAHDISGLDLMRYGVWLARKAGAGKTQVLNALNTEEILSFFQRSSHSTPLAYVENLSS